MDADLQDPPELAIEMIEKWQQGYQVIYAQRSKRHREGWFKRLPAFLFYRLLKRLADIEIPLDTGDFCLMDRQVVDLLNRMPEQNRFIRGLRSWVGFRQTAIRFERDPRFSGEVKYTFAKSFAFAMKLLPVRPHNTRSTSSLEAIAQSVNDWSNRSSRCRDCRLCRYYQPTGRRGGICQLLSVSVKGSWDACAVAESSF